MIEVSHVNVRKSISLLVSRLIVLYIAITIVTLFLFIPSEIMYASLGIETRYIVMVLTIALNIAELFLAIWIILSWLCEYYEIQLDRIIHKYGIFFQHEEQYYTRNIATVECIENFFGELFNYGSIHLYDFMSQKNIWLTMIHNPKRCYKILKELLPERDIKTEYLSKPQVYDSDTEA